MKATIQVRVGLRIKELRGELSMSQEQFTYGIGMARTYFAEVETEKRNVSIKNLERIVEGLGVSFKDFFDSIYFAQP